MVDYIRSYSTRGRLSYIPQDRFEVPERPRSYFAPRSRRPQSLQILRVPPNYDISTEKIRSKRSSVIEKLAVTRESALRFLRHVKPKQAPKDSDDTTTESSRPSSVRLERHSDSPPSGAAEGGRMSWTETMRPGARASVGGPVSGMISRPSLSENVRTASDPSTASTGSGRVASGSVPEEKPIVSGNGISVSISLAEPVLFLQGFDTTELQAGNTAMLRGSLHLKVQKAAKIKAVTLRFKGRATTKWPEGIPPKKSEFEETDNIMSHTWPFFNAQFPTAEAGSGADRVELRGESTGSSLGRSRLAPPGDGDISPISSSTNLSAKDAQSLSLQVNQSRSFGKGESSTGGPSVAQKGYRTFQPGEYTYNFELPLDSRLPETIDVELGTVKYELEAVVERSGAFKANLIGSKDITLIRAPAEGSLEQVEPIAISRNWEDQLHYDIVISGKSFPLGSQVPIAFKLTPLAKVQCHRIKVFVTENTEYFCNNKRVHRMEPVRKVQLFEKRADGLSNSTFPGSSMRITAGGGVPWDQRAAAARGEAIIPQDTSNLLGHLDGDSSAGPTEMEFNVQLPNCSSNREKERPHRLHFDTTYQNIQVHHWIKVVMRLSKPDANEPGRRRHFEISIDSPLHILSCRASLANTSLPAYSSPDAPLNTASNSQLYECGCPGAPRRQTPSQVPTLHALRTTFDSNGRVSTVDSPHLARPQQAHTHVAPGQLQNVQHPQGHRPIHLLRAPSFNPPAFEEDIPPPPLMTPPPEYSDIASPTNGLADYFSRLSGAYEEDSEVEARIERSRSRVDVPLTPGTTRVNRSMDEPRSWMPVGSDPA